MREVWFRGKDKKVGKWIYGSLQCFKGYSIFDGILKNFVTVDGSTIGELTGAVDKNKRKIYEGDIVLYRTVNRDYRKALIVWGSYCFSAKEENSYNRPALDIVMCECNGDIEVIGNIYDDPDKFDMLEE